MKWKTAHGKEIDLQDMNENHITNTLNLLRTQRKALELRYTQLVHKRRPDYNKIDRIIEDLRHKEMWSERFTEELKRRNNWQP